MAERSGLLPGLSLGLLEAGAKRNEFTLRSIGTADKIGNTRKTSLGGATMLQSLFRSMTSTTAYECICGTLNAPNETRASILSVFRQPFTLYNTQEGLMETLSKCDFSPSDLTRKRTAVFIITPDETREMSPIAVGVLNQFMIELISIAESRFARVLPVRVDFIMEEFGTLSRPIPDLPNIVAAARSRNMRFHFVLQSDAQLEAIYGKADKDILLGNVEQWDFFRTRDLTFLEHISKLPGTVEMPSGEIRPLMDVGALQRLEKRETQSEAVVLAGPLKPFVATLKDYLLFTKPKPRVPLRKPERMGKEEKMPVFDIEKAADKALACRMKGIKPPTGAVLK